MNWKWPHTPENSFSPWYQILRRLAFMPLLLVGTGIRFVGVLGAYGLEEAVDDWRNQL